MHDMRKGLMKTVTLATSAVGVSAVPAIALGKEKYKVGRSYAKELMGGGKDGQSNDTADQWVSTTIQNHSVTGYDNKYGTLPQFLQNVQVVCQHIYQAFLGLIILLFVVKIVGRAIFEMVTRDQETFNNIPAFFQTAKERSATKEPTIMKTRAGLFGGMSMSGNAPKDARKIARTYSGPAYISDHPYAEFFKEFIVFMLASMAIFVVIQLMLGTVGYVFGLAQNTPSSGMFSMKNMFGIGN